VGDDSGLVACFGADGEVVLGIRGTGAHAAFGGVVVQFRDAVIEVVVQAVHPGQGGADGSGSRV
jgi:hypothetical protein